jgi:hypothetical protein
VRPLAKTFVTAAVLAAVSLTASGCDTSPYAAVANAHTIKQTTLNAELAAWAGNKQYVNAFDSANGSSGLNVAGFAPGTYNSGWVASILDNAVVAGLIHQHLRALHEALDQPMMQAARAISEISQIGWSSFPPAFRVYQQYKPYFFSQVCLLEAAAFSLEQAQRLSTGGYPGGSQVCYSQTQFENQPADFSQAVMKLGVYQVSQPIKTRYGYQVVEVVSRDVFGFTPQLQRVISVAIVNAQGSPNPAVDGLLVSAKVKVNPQYGTWSQGQITPPKTPGSSQ